MVHRHIGPGSASDDVGDKATENCPNFAWFYPGVVMRGVNRGEVGCRGGVRGAEAPRIIVNLPPLLLLLRPGLGFP